jgi:D-alanyl-D-alanine carboxypeptidase
VTTADLHAHPTGDGNNTAAFTCRAARRQARWSAHAYGLAVDVNPFQNPYRRGDLVLPELASAYLDRGRVRPGMIRPGDVVTRAFADIGWTWGGTWRSPTDLMHFSATGN